MKKSDELLLKRIGGYTLVGKTLGKGAFARVELATHRLSNTKVALKIIDLDKTHESYLRKNVLRESAILKNLRHDNIVRLYETLAHRNVYCFVTEYLEGGDLFTYLQEQREKKLSEKHARKFFTQLLSAIQYLHSRGVIHRDLKMQNIMLTENKKKLKLIDFGLSNYFNKENLLKTRCGSAQYAAPELFDSGANYGPSVEIWSLTLLVAASDRGVILYAMTTGKMPFQVKASDRKESFIIQIRRGLNISHEHSLKKLNPELKKVLLQMLEPDTEKRLSLTGVLTNVWVTENGKSPLLPMPPEVIPHSLREKIVERVGELYSKTVDDTVRHLHSNQYDSMDATFQLLLDKSLKFQRTKGQSRVISPKHKRSKTSSVLKRGTTPVEQSTLRRRDSTPLKLTHRPKEENKLEDFEKVKSNGATKFKEETEKSFTTCLRIIKPQPFQPPEKSIKNDDSFEFMKTPYRLSRRTRETHDSKPTYEGSNNKKEKQHRYRVKTSESKLIETTIEGVVELNSEQYGSDTPNQVEVEARNIRVTISGEKLKGASFRITAENEENIIPVRVHKSNVPKEHPSFRRRSLSPFQARQMLHRYTYPLKKTSVRPEETTPLLTQDTSLKQRQLVFQKPASPKHGFPKKTIGTYLQEQRANIISSPESFLRAKHAQPRSISREEIARSSIENAQQILIYERKMSQQNLDHQKGKAEKKVTFKMT